MKTQSGKPIKKLADDQLDLENLDQTQDAAEEEEEEDADDEVIPEVKEDEIEAVGGDDEDECTDCDDEDEGEEEEEEDAEDGAVVPGTEDADEADADDEIPDVDPNETEPVDEGEEDADKSFSDWAAEEANEHGADDVEDEDGDEDGNDEADADDEIPDVGEDEVEPVDTGDSEEEEEEEDADADEEVPAPAPAPAPAADPVPTSAPAGEEEEEEEEDAEDGDEVLDDDGDDEADSCMGKGAAAGELVIEPIFELDANTEIKATNLSMQLFNADSKDPHWVVFNNGEPLCKIALSAQPDAEDVRESFVSDGYAGSLLESIRELATAEAPVSPISVLAALPAKFYYAAVQKSKLAEIIKSQVTTEVTAKIAGANDDYNEKLMDNMDLVVGYQAKNLYREPDPFKVGLVQRIKKAGVDQEVAIAIVEDAFLTEVPEWHKRVVAKAKEYCTYTPESLREIKAALGDAGQKQVEYDSILERDDQRTVIASGLENRKPSRGVPLESYVTSNRTAGNNKAGDETSEFKARVKSGISGLRFHGRRS